MIKRVTVLTVAVFIMVTALSQQVISYSIDRSVLVGNFFSIKLEANRTMGYKWDYEIENKELLEIISDKYKKYERKEEKDGVGGERVFDIKGIKAGKTTIEFKLYQPWNEGEIAKTRKYTITIKSKKKEVIVDNYFKIILEANRTTGYKWDYEIENKELLEVISDKYKKYERKEEKDGVGGERVFDIKGIKAGKTTIEFKFYQPWNEDEIAKTREYNVEVK